MKKEKRQYPPLEIRICGDQLLTRAHLDEFKEELLADIRQLLQGTPVPVTTKWLKSDEVKKLLHVSSGTLQAMRRNGTLPYTKIGGIIYYNMDDIQQMLAMRKRGSTSREGHR